MLTLPLQTVAGVSAAVASTVQTQSSWAPVSSVLSNWVVATSAVATAVFAAVMWRTTQRFNNWTISQREPRPNPVRGQVVEMAASTLSFELLMTNPGDVPLYLLSARVVLYTKDHRRTKVEGTRQIEVLTSSKRSASPYAELEKLAAGVVVFDCRFPDREFEKWGREYVGVYLDYLRSGLILHLDIDPVTVYWETSEPTRAQVFFSTLDFERELAPNPFK